MAETATKVFKNWAAICELGEESQLMMMAIACLNLAKPTSRTNQIIAAFADCFCEEQKIGPYPLSYIRKRGGEGAMREGSDFSRGEERPVSYDTLDGLNIPCIILAYSDRELEKYPEWLVHRPENISTHCLQGSIVDYKGTEMMVLENNDGLGEIALVPPEIIDVNC